MLFAGRALRVPLAGNGPMNGPVFTGDETMNVHHFASPSSINGQSMNQLLLRGQRARSKAALAALRWLFKRR